MSSNCRSIEPDTDRAPGGHPALLLLLAGAGWLWLPAPAAAQQWVVTPRVEIGGQYIDNPRLRESGEAPDPDPDNPDPSSSEDTVSGGLLDLGVAFRRIAPTSSVVFLPRAALYRYTGDSNEDSERYSADFDSVKEGQRSEWRFRGNYDQQQVLRGETTSSDIDDDDIGIDDDIQTESGHTFERRQRDRWRARPGFTFDFTERTAFAVDVNYLAVEYDRQELGEAVNYTNSKIDAAIVRQLTQDSELEFGVFASKYDPESVRPETDSIGGRLRYQKEVSNISRFFIEVGGQESTIDLVDPVVSEVSDTSFLWDIGYDRRLERTLWRFSLGQAVTPSGSGAMVQRDMYRVGMTHQLRPRWSLDLAALAMNIDNLVAEDVVTRSDRDYAQVRAILGYELSRKWAFETRYTLTHQDFADIPGDGQEHALRISFVYQPPVPTR